MTTASTVRRRALVVLCALALAAAACGSGEDEASPEVEVSDGGVEEATGEAEGSETAGETAAETPDDQATEATEAAESAAGEAGEGQPGGTLLVAGGADVLHIDPSSAYSAGDYQIQRAIHRTLLAYPPNDDSGEPVEPLPDLAVEVPTLDNGGISEDGLTYTIALRDGISWGAADGPREIVAEDVVLGVKRICNPVVPSDVVLYYTSTIAGLEDYCAGFAEVEGTVEAIRAYIEGNDIEGVTADDEKTVEITLTQPASDFLSILALGSFVSPQPEEYLDYLPDSPELRQATVPSGPYRITEYVPEQRYVLERNEAWDPETDDLREAYVDTIEIAMGQEAEAVHQQIVAGTVDMQWNDTTTPSQQIPALVAANDDRLVISGDGSIRPYIVINTLSPNADGAFASTEVRQALNFAVDKGALIQTLGGPALAEPAFSVLPPQVPGHSGDNPLEVPVEGDPERARALLEEAGVTQPVPVRVLYRETSPYRDMAAVLQQDLEEAGFAPELRVTTQNAFYEDFLLNADGTAAGEWDIALAAWGPDYLRGRAYIVPMLDGRDYADGSPNFGGYNNDDLNAAIDSALAAPDDATAAESWAEADRIAAEDAAWVPVAFTNTPTMHSERVQGFAYWVPAHNGDFTNVWIEG